MTKSEATLRTYATREEWLAARKGSIGSSDIPDLVGAKVDGREPKGMWWLWLKLRGLQGMEIADRERFEELEGKALASLNLEARTAMEPVIERWAQKQSGITIVDPGHAIVKCKAWPRFHCSPDGMVTAGLSGDRVMDWAITGAEYKTIHPYARRQWTKGDPSEYALYQAHWSMLLMGVDHYWIFGQVGFGDSRHDRLSYEVPRNDELCDLLREQAEKLLEYVDSDTPPPVDGFAKTTQAIRLLYKSKVPSPGRMVTLPPDGGWPDPKLDGRAISWAELDRERRYIADRLDELGRRDTQLKQAAELEMQRLKADRAVIPPERDGDPTVTYSMIRPKGKSPYSKPSRVYDDG